jgi:hypothetical protein
MIAALILGISLVILLQFFVSYCRSLIAACAGQELSPEAREVTGISGRSVSGDEFRKLVELVHLCPETGADGNRLRAVTLYFRMMNLVRQTGARLAPAVAAWAETERQACAYFAAVALDHRMSHSRDLVAEQTSTNL